jgi:hypothetical protein
VIAAFRSQVRLGGRALSWFNRIEDEWKDAVEYGVYELDLLKSRGNE